MRRALVVLALIGAISPCAAAETASQYGSIVYLSPERPDTSYFTVTGLPSFVFMPNAPTHYSDAAVRMGSGQGIAAAIRPAAFSQSDTSALGAYPTSPVDLDCSHLSGSVAVGSYDPHGLDADGDGIGCE